MTTTKLTHRILTDLGVPRTKDGNRLGLRQRGVLARRQEAERVSRIQREWVLARRHEDDRLNWSWGTYASPEPWTSPMPAMKAAEEANDLGAATEALMRTKETSQHPWR